MKNKKIKLTSLWKSQTKDGEEYFKGPFGAEHTLFIFKNKWKKREEDPDYTVSLLGPDAFNVALRTLGDDPYLKKAIEKAELDTTDYGRTTLETPYASLPNDDIPF